MSGGAVDHAVSIEKAVAALSRIVTLESHEPPPHSHSVIHVRGLEAPDAIAALGSYLTGVVAGFVAVDLTIANVYFGPSARDADQLGREVAGVIGASNEITTAFRSTRRDPWIAECLGHLVLLLTKDEPGLCVPGPIWAATLPHDKVTKQGLDLLAVYEDDALPALCIGEAKASASAAASHLNASVRLFREVDRGERDFEIRTMVNNSLEVHIPPEVRSQLPGMFWRDRRLYMPVISYSAGSDFDPSADRPKTFGKLTVTVDRRRCVSVPIADFDGFFDLTADAMRTDVESYQVVSAR